MPGQHPNAVKEDRSRRAIAVAQEMSRAYRQQLVGSVHEVLFEEADGEFYTGHAPNYVKVYVKGEDLHNRILPVTLTVLHQDGMLGQILPD
jgi:threonylcarbamoyladenosine tRNA methylthiotransferase MtaB